MALQKKKYKLGKKIFYLALIFLLIFISTLCRQSYKKDKNIILITIDTQRYDYISSLYRGNAETPQIDLLAAKGTIFENCYTEIPITLPSHATIFYSLPPHKLHIYNNGQLLQKNDRQKSLAEIFQQKGFTTAAFVSLGVLKSKFGLSRGFQTYIDDFPSNRWYLNAEEVNLKVFPWLNNHRENNFFLWIHYSDPHLPYAPPDLPPDLAIHFNNKIFSQVSILKGEKHSLQFNLTTGKNVISFTNLNNFPDLRNDYRIRLKNLKFTNIEGLDIKFKDLLLYDNNQQKNILIKENGKIIILNEGKTKKIIIGFDGDLNLLPSEQIDLYKREVEYLDKKIGELIAELKRTHLFNKSIIILTADHGEGLGENKDNFGNLYFGHIHYLYNIYIKVPMIISNPFSKSSGKRIQKPVTLLDIAPSVMGLMGWKKKKYHAGNDLYFKNKQNNPIIFEETYTPEAAFNKFAILNYPWHLILTPAQQNYELFNIQKDAYEKSNVMQKYKDLDEVKKLKIKLNKRIQDILNQKKEVNLDKKSLEMLKSLGYIK